MIVKLRGPAKPKSADGIAKEMSRIRKAWFDVAYGRRGTIVLEYQGPEWAVREFIDEMKDRYDITAETDRLGMTHEITSIRLTEKERKTRQRELNEG